MKCVYLNVSSPFTNILTNPFINYKHCFGNASHFQVLSRRLLDMYLGIREGESGDCNVTHLFLPGILNVAEACMSALWSFWIFD